MAPDDKFSSMILWFMSSFMGVAIIDSLFDNLKSFLDYLNILVGLSLCTGV